MTTPDPHTNNPCDLVPHLVPDLVPDDSGAHVETTSSPVPSSSIGDEVSEPPPPRPTTSSPSRDDHPQKHPVEEASNPMPERRVCEPQAGGLEDLIRGIHTRHQVLPDRGGSADIDALRVEVDRLGALLDQRDAIAANRNALALKLADARAEAVAMRERGDRWQHSWLDATANLATVTAAAHHPHKGPDDTDASMLLAAAKRLDGGFEPGGSHTKQTVARVLRAVAGLLPGEASAAGELHDQPHQQHDRGEASQADGQDDQQFGALGVADEGVHGASVGAAPSAGPGIGDVPDPRFAGSWVNPPGRVPPDLPVATGFTSTSESCPVCADIKGGA